MNTQSASMAAEKAERTLILNNLQIQQKVNRIAYQIYEDHYDEKVLIIAGIAKQGYEFAKMISKQLKEISSLEISLLELKIDKKNPIDNNISLDFNEKDIKGKSIVLVDDVLNSGRTMIYGAKYFLQWPVKKLSIAVLVNRSHKRFPVYATYEGLSLATTLKEHVEAVLDGKSKNAVYLE